MLVICLVILDINGICGFDIEILVVICVNLVSIGFISNEWNVCDIVSWCIWWFLWVKWLVILLIVVLYFEIIIECGVLIVVRFVLLISIGSIFFLLVVIIIIILLVGNFVINLLWVVIKFVVLVNDNILVKCVVVILFIECLIRKFGLIF